MDEFLTRELVFIGEQGEVAVPTGAQELGVEALVEVGEGGGREGGWW